MAKTSPRNNRTICTPFCNKTYVDTVECPQKFRAQLDDMIARCPEIFPLEIQHGYRMKDSYVSIRLNIRIRRIEVENTNFTIRPSFVMPYQTAFTKDIDNALFLRKFDIPFWALAHVFGRNASFWYRLESHLGRFSIVGTTIKEPAKLPAHLVADEKHTKIRGKKCYIPTTVAEGCILGVAVTEKADNADLERGYSTFKQEALDLKPKYSPKTVNTDGWAATKNAFGNLFPSICIDGPVFCIFTLRYATDPRKNTGSYSSRWQQRFGNVFKPPQGVHFPKKSEDLWKQHNTNRILM